MVFCDADPVFLQDAMVDDLCDLTGAKLLPSAPYEHWMNGLAERGHQTLFSRAQALRLHAGAPKRYWGECLKQATIIINNVYPAPNSEGHASQADP